MLATATKVRAYPSSSPEYQEAFNVFLAHTDQKARAMAWLEARVAGLADKRVFIDAGAGNGKLTAQLASRFQTTLAIEPNPSLAAELRSACRGAELIATPIAAARPEQAADFILCSHVFYYIPEEEWLETLGRLSSWLAPRGLLVVALQNANTDCMRMVWQFLRRGFDLSGLAWRFSETFRELLEVELTTVPAWIRTAEAEPARAIAEFMLNLLPMAEPPEAEDLARYVDQHFRGADGGYRFSCDQDFLCLRRVAD